MKYCITCGAKIPDRATFCPVCGHKQTYSYVPHNSGDVTVERQPQYQPTSHIAKPKKSKSTAWLLWFFLGWTGAHRFYLHTKEAYLTPILYGIVWFYMILFNHVISVTSYYFNMNAFRSDCDFIFFLGFALYLVWWIIDAFHINKWLQSSKVNNYHPIKNYRVITLSIYTIIVLSFIIFNHALIYISFIH